MSARRFSLEAVLQLRRKEKETAEGEFAAAIRRREAAAARLAEERAELERQAEDLRSMKFSAASRARAWRALCMQEQFCKQLHAAWNQEVALATQARESLDASHRNCELVERLKEQWIDDLRRAEQKEEEAQLEEFVSARRGRKRL